MALYLLSPETSRHLKQTLNQKTPEKDDGKDNKNRGKIDSPERNRQSAPDRVKDWVRDSIEKSDNGVIAVKIQP
jgi:hypothetical protein